MKNHLLFICVFWGLATLVGLTPAFGAEINSAVSDGLYNPGAQKPITYRMKDGTVLQTSDKNLVFQLSITRPGMQTVSLALPVEINQVDSINLIPGNRVSLIGRIGSDVYEVVLIDVSQCRITDKFWALDPSPSPNRRFIAYTKFYPPHFVPGVSDFVLVYDVTRSPAANRPADAPHLDESTGAGVAVYPPGVKTQDPNTGLPGSDTYHVGSQLFWAPDSSAFVFSAEHQLPNDQSVTQNENAPMPVKTEVNLVLVDLTSPASPKTSVFPVNVCEWPKPCLENLTNVDFEDNGLKVQFDGGTKRTLQVKYDQFRP